MKELTSAERRTLRAKAHPLNPVVIIGNDGLTPGVMAEVERSLKAHELIKIRVGGMEYAERAAACEAICTQTGASQVQHIGKVLVVYRKRPAEEEKKTGPRKPRNKAATAGRRGDKPPARGAPLAKPGDTRSASGRRPRIAR